MKKLLSWYFLTEQKKKSEIISFNLTASWWNNKLNLIRKLSKKLRLHCYSFIKFLNAGAFSAGMKNELSNYSFTGEM